jgi:hypothetical protein
MTSMQDTFIEMLRTEIHDFEKPIICHRNYSRNIVLCDHVLLFIKFQTYYPYYRGEVNPQQLRGFK